MEGNLLLEQFSRYKKLELEASPFHFLLDANIEARSRMSATGVGNALSPGRNTSRGPAATGKACTLGGCTWSATGWTTMWTGRS